MKQAEDFHIQRARNINGSLIGALDWINPDNEDVSLMPDDVKYDKAIESYHKAVAFFMEEMQETTREQLPDGTKPNSMDELQKRLTYFQKIITQAEEKGIHIADIEHVKELCATASDLIARSSKDEDLSFDNAQYDELIKHYNDLVISLMKGIQEAPQPPPLATAGDKKDIKELQAAVASFQNIVQQSEKETSILIPGIENVKNALVTAMAWINSPDDIEMKYDNALERYQAATTLLVEGIEQCLTNGPPKPQEANFFIKFLRFITRNEKLLQTADEKRYESQLSILPKIDQLAEKMGFIKPSTNTGLIEPVENNEDTQGITRGLS